MKVGKFKIALVIAISLGVLVCAAIVYAQAINVLALGTISNSQLFDGPATVTVRTLTINPATNGENSLAWHYHPGYAFNVVKSGTLTVEDGCGGEETLHPGDAFEEMDGRVHRAKNLSATEPVVVYNTFIVPQGKPTTRNIPGNERRCGPPEDIDECKSDGWLNFNHPQSFISQGQCVEFVRHRPRNVIPVPEDPLNQVEGTIADSQLFDGPAKLTARTFTVKPGEVVPRHYHPGHAFNVVKSGTVTLEDGCGRVLTLRPGQGFEAIDGRVHRPKNLGDTDVVVYDTFLIPEGKPTTVNLGNEPRCGPPNDVDECQNGGWRNFNHPQTFVN